MNSTPGAHAAGSEWRTLYEAAVLELDQRKLPQRIEAAQHAIMQCLQRLDGFTAPPESESLKNALQVLHDLREIAAKDGSSDAA
jgi:hypothetical protein